jgi:hypothetical protein
MIWRIFVTGLVAPSILVLATIRPATLEARGKPVCDNESGPREKFDIPFLIFGDDLIDFGTGECLRKVRVMMDEKAFSEEAVRRLSAYISESFVKPRYMHVFFYTSVEQVDPFGPANISTAAPPDGYSKHHRGIYIRTENDELIRITEKPTDLRLKTIILRGHDTI